MMTNNNKIFKTTIYIFAMVFLFTSCDKLARPKLGDYPKDANAPGGPLKFYVAFDGTTADPLMNAVDSIRANFPSDNPLASTDGVNGKGVQGVIDKAIKYPGANDFKGATSCTISLWVNNTVNPNTELYFSLFDKDVWEESGAFLLVEHATPTQCQFKFALMDHWVEYIDDPNNPDFHPFNEPLFNGQWHHLAFTYDETTSTVKVYFDGTEVALPPKAARNFAGLGKLDFKNASNLVLGGWNKHAGLEGPPDDWISAFTGKMDQFRLYNKVLTASEILALYNSKL